MYGGTLRDHQAQMIEAARRLMGSEMLVPTIPSKSRMYEMMYRGVEPVEKTLTQEMIEKYSRDDAAFTVDYSKLEARMMDHLRQKLTSPRERRLGSSSKHHVKFLPDPVKEKPK